jgi:diguanylate cyclase (GGDEF)-like protein
MDHWERRLQLTARAAAPGGQLPTRTPVARARRPAGAPATAPLESPPGADVADLIHPDEAQVVTTLMNLARARPGFRAELTLLVRNLDRWEHHRFEVVGEVMGPVIRVVDGPVVELGEVFRREEAPSGGARPARTEVLDQVRAALGRVGDQKRVAVLLFDLDRFKLHNDLLGAERGNELLAVMAERIAGTVAPAYAANIGGDEYAVVVESVDGAETVRPLAEQVRRAVAVPVEIGEEWLTVTTTVGIAIGGSEAEADHLLRDADTALFAGKDRGRDRVEVFGSKLEARAARQLSSAQQLRRALSDGTLQLHYQPVHALDTGRVVAAEALMRIEGGPDRLPISPAALVDAAEDSGLIARLGRYILEETTSQVALWEERLGDDHDFRVSVNISPVQLGNHDFLSAMRHALHAARVSPRRLSLEITGSVLLGLGPALDSVIGELTDMGIAFGLDEFGTDASSLGGLRRFPIRFVKIDRELVSAVDEDERAEAIVASTISLARRLDISTIAVGVERTGQHEMLRSLGCDAAQGYLYAPPLDARTFTDLF